MFIFSLLFLWCWGHLCIMTLVNSQDYLMQLLFFFREHKIIEFFLWTCSSQIIYRYPPV
jgi:hypothetical protein